MLRRKYLRFFEGETFLAEHHWMEEVLMTEYIKHIYAAEGIMTTKALEGEFHSKYKRALCSALLVFV